MMTKKEKKVAEEQSVKQEDLGPLVSEGHIGFLKPDEYWSWRISIAEWRKAETEQKLKEAQLKSLEKDVEISKLRAGLFALTEIDSAKKATQASKQQYEDIKKSFEERLHHSLNDCIINDVTYEVSHVQPIKTANA